MCTAVSFRSRDHYFGRNLDLEYHFNEEVVITPRNYPFSYRCSAAKLSHFALIGMATVVDGYPLYYDATNEFGLSIAGLNFPGNAAYQPPAPDKENITPFELIPWILGQCKTVTEAKTLLENINIVNIPFSTEHKLTPLHWMICDRTQSIVVEPMADGLKVYDNPTDVLTNNPPFPYHMYHLNDYMGLSREKPLNRFSNRLSLGPYSNGMGGIGLPGDLSSASRFVRAAFVKNNSVCKPDETSSISQFFHILGSVAQQRGCARVNDAYEITYYSSCCNTNKGIYYYKTYENSQISAVGMRNVDLDTDQLYRYPLVCQQQIRYVN